jgi:purine-cytosine permease-like protein
VCSGRSIAPTVQVKLRQTTGMPHVLIILWVMIAFMLCIIYGYEATTALNKKKKKKRATGY